MEDIILSERMPVLALRGLTVFPGASMHFDVGREKSIRALDKAMERDQKIFLVTQKSILVDDPKFSDLYPVGTVVQVRQVLKIPGNSVRILVQGEYRAQITQQLKDSPYLCARVESLPEPGFVPDHPRIEALIRQSAQLFDEFTELSQRPVQDVMLRLLAERHPGHIADLIGQAATFGFAEKMRILQLLHPVQRLMLANRLLGRELEVLRLENELQDKTQQNIDKGQRDYYLREQMKVIRTELGDGDDEGEIEEYREKIRTLSVDEEVRQKLHKELTRLSKQGYGSSESAVIRN